MNKKNKVPFFASLQVKYALSYFVIFAVVLVLLNTYPLMASQELLFTSKRDSLKSQTAVMASALMELESLSAEQVARVMNMLDSMGTTRILVTDPAGLILYDSTRQPGEGEEDSSNGEAEYRYALYQEVVSALRGNDVFYSRYVDRMFTSTAAMPIVYRGMVIGAIYILEVDQAQGQLLDSLQQNLRTISLVIAAVTVVMSTFFSKMLTARIAALLRAIRIVGEGEYGHRLQPVGRDEMAQLAGEFNQLTDRLQTTEEVRRRFVSDASHELKTPLASIRLLTDSILQNEAVDPDTVREFVGDIGEEAERLQRITEKLLTLTRLDAGTPVEAEAVPVEEVAQRVTHMLRPLARAVEVDLRVKLEEGLTVRATRDDLYQILFNLMENAVKYNLPGGEITLAGKGEEAWAVLTVEDTGVGIPEEDIDRIFDRFYRVDKARSRAAGGTGLGLSIVRDTARRHGGDVTAHRREGKGTCFTVRLPIQKEEGQ